MERAAAGAVSWPSFFIWLALTLAGEGIIKYFFFFSAISEAKVYL